MKFLVVALATGLLALSAQAKEKKETDRKPASPAIGAKVTCTSSGKPSIAFNVKYSVSVTDDYYESEASLVVNGNQQVSKFDTDAYVSPTVTSDNGNKIEHYGSPSYPTKFIGYNNGRLYKVAVKSYGEGKVSGTLTAIDYVKAEVAQKIKLSCIVSHEF